ncbi:hypothetical protein [Streptomyces sp. NPDC005017]
MPLFLDARTDTYLLDTGDYRPAADTVPFPELGGPWPQADPAAGPGTRTT